MGNEKERCTRSNRKSGDEPLSRTKTKVRVGSELSQEFLEQVGVHQGSVLLLLLFTRPLPRDGGMAEDHGAPDAVQLPRVWTRDLRDRESPKSERRKESVAGQCRMR